MRGGWGKGYSSFPKCQTCFSCQPNASWFLRTPPPPPPQRPCQCQAQKQRRPGTFLQWARVGLANLPVCARNQPLAPNVCSHLRRNYTPLIRTRIARVLIKQTQVKYFAVCRISIRKRTKRRKKKKKDPSNCLRSSSLWQFWVKEV